MMHLEVQQDEENIVKDVPLTRPTKKELEKLEAEMEARNPMYFSLESP
jgi:hypothetical protein